MMPDNTCPSISPRSLPFGQTVMACGLGSANATTDPNTKSRTTYMKLTSVKISDIRTDGDTQNRCEFDRDLVSEYSRAMHEGAVFPPMLVFFDGTHYWLADGFHRHAACVDIGLEFVDVQVKEGSLRDAQLYSFSANANHGKRRTNADKRRAVQTMLGDSEWSQLSDREIARICQVGNEMVSRLRRESSLCDSHSEKPAERTYTTKHGTEAKMKTANIGKVKGLQEPELILETSTTDEDDENTTPPETLEYTQKHADADNAKALEEHELRMAELAHLMTEESPLGEALREVERLSREILKKDELIHFYNRRLNGVNEEINLYKRELARYRKAFAARDREERKKTKAERNYMHQDRRV
jgi:hypothetical protein